MDYSREIPFYKRAPLGFYSTTREKKLEIERVRLAKPLWNSSLQKLEGTRKDVIEARERRKDARKTALKQMNNLPDALLQSNKYNDPGHKIRRTAMNLPDAQIGDDELEEIAKLSAQNEELEGISEEGTSATRKLLGDYHALTPTPSATMRNRAQSQRAVTPASGNTIMMEAQNLIALQSAQTPLRGGENTPLHPTDWSGITPRKVEVQTPNPLATPLRGRSKMTPNATPLRDQLHINESDGTEMGEDGMLEEQQLMALRSQVKMGLAALPTPKNDYLIQVPQLEEDDSDDQMDVSQQVVEDAEHAKKRIRQSILKAEQQRLRLRSQAVKQNLPRPSSIQADYTNGTDEIDGTLRSEMLTILEHDNGNETADWQEFSESQLSQARKMLHEEFIDSDVKEIKPTQFAKAMQQSSELSVKSLPKTEGLNSLKRKFDVVFGQVVKERKRAKKAERTVAVYQGGYAKRSNNLHAEISGPLWNTLSERRRELETFKRLHEQESLAAQNRVAQLQNAVHMLRERETQLQATFAKINA
eukprot:TRINITY_DN16175_c0_g1_i1.p1 TRINITY_DN16175_c0_g1~~TRINITY_DN16175_c0_g1_i1.p1  ORF type:complete len:531 (-),score=126.61 TRINITY_DN16175_c0_g1_i1:45-1637(-)